MQQQMLASSQQQGARDPPDVRAATTTAPVHQTAAPVQVRKKVRQRLPNRRPTAACQALLPAVTDRCMGILPALFRRRWRRLTPPRRPSRRSRRRRRRSSHTLTWSFHRLGPYPANHQTMARHLQSAALGATPRRGGRRRGRRDEVTRWAGLNHKKYEGGGSWWVDLAVCE